MSSTITVTADERHIILEQMWRWTGGDDPVDFDTREAAVETLDRLQRAFRVCEELGWGDDDGRTEFELTVTPPLVQFIADGHREAAESAQDERVNREKCKTDLDGWGFEPALPLAENLRRYDELIANEDREAALFGAVLARIEQQQAPVTA